MAKPVDAVLFDMGGTLRYRIKDLDMRESALLQLKETLGFAGTEEELHALLKSRSSAYKAWCTATLREAPEEELARLLNELAAEAQRDVTGQGVSADQVSLARRVDLRYAGLDATITVAWSPEAPLKEMYESRHEQLYGFRQRRDVEIVALRAEASSLPQAPQRSQRLPPKPPPQGTAAELIHDGQTMAAAIHRRHRPLGRTK